MLFVYAWLSVNIYLPVLPQLESIFHTSPQLAKLTVSIFLFGFAFTQLIWGPMSDRFGRKPVLLVGVAISAVGALLAGFSTGIYFFIAARLLESIGMGVGPVLARSLLTDSLDKTHVAIAMAYAAILAAILPAVAPILGGYLDLILTWRGIFFFLALFGTSLWLLTLTRVEESNPTHRKSLSVFTAFREYIEMLGNSKYRGYLIIYFISFGSVVGYYATSPVIFIKVLGYSPHQYGYLLIVNVIAYVLGVMLSRFLIPVIGINRPLFAAILLAMLACAIFIGISIFTTISAWSILIPISLYIFASGIASPSINAGAMTMFRDRAGASTALVGFSMAVGSAVCTGILSNFHVVDLWQITVYVCICALIMLTTFLVSIGRKTAED